MGEVKSGVGFVATGLRLPKRAAMISTKERRRIFAFFLHEKREAI
jgi:hypothetical protein